MSLSPRWWITRGKPRVRFFIRAFLARELRFHLLLFFSLSPTVLPLCVCVCERERARSRSAGGKSIISARVDFLMPWTWHFAFLCRRRRRGAQIYIYIYILSARVRGEYSVLKALGGSGEGGERCKVFRALGWMCRCGWVNGVVNFWKDGFSNRIV